MQQYPGCPGSALPPDPTIQDDACLLQIAAIASNHGAASGRPRADWQGGRCRVRRAACQVAGVQPGTWRVRLSESVRGRRRLDGAIAGGAALRAPSSGAREPSGMPPRRSRGSGCCWACTSRCWCWFWPAGGGRPCRAPSSALAVSALARPLPLWQPSLVLAFGLPSLPCTPHRRAPHPPSVLLLQWLWSTTPSASTRSPPNTGGALRGSPTLTLTASSRQRCCRHLCWSSCLSSWQAGDRSCLQRLHNVPCACMPAPAPPAACVRLRLRHPLVRPTGLCTGCMLSREVARLTAALCCPALCCPLPPQVPYLLRTVQLVVVMKRPAALCLRRSRTCCRRCSCWW